MPSTSAPFGFLPVRHPTGQLRPTAYVSSNSTDLMIPSGTNIAFYKGQPIYAQIGDGSTAYNGVTPAAGRMIFRPWTANTDRIWGVFAGVEYVDANGKPWVSDTWPASQTLLAGARQVVYVWDDPEIVYKAQMDGVPSTGAYALTGKGVNGSNFASGSTLTGLSAATLSLTIPATGAQGQFTVIKLHTADDNTSSDTYPIYEVKVQYSQLTYARVSL